MNRLAGLALFGLLVATAPRADQPDPVQQELIALTTARAEAIVARDGAFLQQLYADEYMFTGANGSVADKSTDIAEVVSGRLRVKGSRLARLKVRRYGDVAQVTGVNMMKAKYDGKSISGQYRFTELFVQRAGQWQLVASHLTLMKI